MSAAPEHICRLCQAEASSLGEPPVMCFGPIDSNEYTAADVLNKHFWFELHCEHDAKAFVCQPCWRKVDDFHRFYQSILQVYQSQCWMQQQPKQELDSLKDGGFFAVDVKLAVVLNDDEPLSQLHYSDEDAVVVDNVVESLQASDSDDHNALSDSSEPIATTEQSNNGEGALRKRGRPRKMHASEPAIADLPAKRKPGRPRKSDAFVKIEQTNEPTTAANQAPCIASNRVLIATAAERDIGDMIAQYFTLQCDLCAAPNANLTEARAHHQQQHGQRGYLTCGCGQRFRTIDAVRKHCHFHADASEHKCMQCCKTFANRQRLTMHLKFMHTEAAAAEAQSNASASNNRTVIGCNSREQHQLNDELLRRFISMTCGECGATYTTFSEARQHHLHAHGQRGYVECCGKKFVQKSRAVKHCQWHENPKQFECPICFRMLFSQNSLAEHTIRRHADNSQQRHQCELCSCSYRLLSQLRGHQRVVHTPTEERKFECYRCHKRFVFLSQLTCHLRQKHGDQGPSHVCDVCAKQFKTKATYDLHYAVEHGTVSVKKQCPECGKWMKHSVALSRHLFQHNSKPRTCDECGKLVPNYRALKAHQRNVHCEPQHPCLVCGKLFKKLLTLREHTAIHAGITDLYTCAYCPKTFRSMGNMYKHRRQVHAERAQADKLAAQRAADEQNAAEAAAANAQLAAERAVESHTHMV